MAQYATLSLKTPGVNNENHSSDNLLMIPQTQSNIPGSYSGNKGDGNAYCSYNTTYVLASGTDCGVRNQSSVPIAREAGIIRVPERFLAKS